MRRFLILLIALLFASPSYAGQVVPIWDDIDTTYTDIDLYWGMESTSIEKSAGDGTASLTGATISDVRPYIGTNALLQTAVSHYAEIDVSSSDIINHLTGRLGININVDNWGDDTAILFVWYNADNRMMVKIDDTDEIKFSYKSNGVASQVTTADSPIGQDTDLYIEITWVHATSTFRLRVNGGSWYEDAGNTPGAWAGTPTKLYIGSYDGVAAGDVYTDHLIITTSTSRDLNAIKTLTSFPD